MFTMFHSLSALISPIFGGILYDKFGHIITLEFSMILLLIYFIIYVISYSGF